jgi:hypothetical protein
LELLPPEGGVPESNKQVLSAAQLAELDARTQKNKKKTIPALAVDGEGRVPPRTLKVMKETSTSRRFSVGTPIPSSKKTKTPAKSPTKTEAFDFKRDSEKPTEAETASVPHVDIGRIDDVCAVIHEQAGEESEEDEGANPAAALQTEECKGLRLEISRAPPRRSSTHLEGMMLRRSSIHDQSLEEDPVNNSDIMAEQTEEQKAKYPKAARKGKKRNTKQSQTWKKPTQKKLISSLTELPTLRVVILSPGESPTHSVKALASEDSLKAAGRHSPISSLSSNSDSELSEENNEGKEELGEEIEGESKPKRKKANRSKRKHRSGFSKLAHKRAGRLFSDASDCGSEIDSGLPRNPADEVFVRHFALNMMAFMHSIAPKRSAAAARGLTQLSKVRKEVLSMGYGPIPSETGRRVSIFSKRRDSFLGTKRQRFRKSITSGALEGLKENLDEALHTSDNESDSNDSISSADMRLAKFSRAEFEIKHLSMLKSLALRLMSLMNPSEPEEIEAITQLTPVELWEKEYKDQHETVSCTLDKLFKDTKALPITAFTSVVTSFFKDPQAARSGADDTEELERMEIDTNNYREALERRKFEEYWRQLSNQQRLRLAQSEALCQLTSTRLNPSELSHFFHNHFLKRKRRRFMQETRNGAPPAVLYARPRVTDTGLALEYYQTMVRRARKARLPKDVVLSGGAHVVKSEEEYNERVYCRLKHEKDLLQLSRLSSSDA